MSEFDPFDPKTYKQNGPLEDPEHRQRIIELINQHIASNEEWSFMLELAHRLEGVKASLTFHRRVHKEPELQQLVDWLVSSEPRRERASKEIRKWLRLKRCPHCNELVDEADFRDPPKFDWDKFSSEE